MLPNQASVPNLLVKEMQVQLLTFKIFGLIWILVAFFGLSSLRGVMGNKV